MRVRNCGRILRGTRTPWTNSNSLTSERGARRAARRSPRWCRGRTGLRFGRCSWSLRMRCASKGVHQHRRVRGWGATCPPSPRVRSFRADDRCLLIADRRTSWKVQIRDAQHAICLDKVRPSDPIFIALGKRPAEHYDKSLRPVVPINHLIDHVRVADRPNIGDAA
jgi:hypothetical protein